MPRIRREPGGKLFGVGRCKSAVTAHQPLGCSALDSLIRHRLHCTLPALRASPRSRKYAHTASPRAPVARRPCSQPDRSARQFPPPTDAPTPPARKSHGTAITVLVSSRTERSPAKRSGSPWGAHRQQERQTMRPATASTGTPAGYGFGTNGARKERSTMSLGSVDTGWSRQSQRIISGKIAPPCFWP